jgi:hypothetical protein
MTDAASDVVNREAEPARIGMCVDDDTLRSEGAYQERADGVRIV